MPGGLVVDLKEGYQQLVDAMPEDQRQAISRARVLSNAEQLDRAGSLFGLVELYRAGPRQIWGPVLLDVLAPALLRRLQRLRIEPPFIDQEDLSQALVAELLEAASGMPLPANPAYLRRRLLDRANQRLRRTLARERRRQVSQTIYEAASQAQP